MTNLANASCRWLAGLALAALASAPAFAGTYNIKLFQGATGVGTGSFPYTNPGGPPARSDPVTVTTPPGLQTNASLPVVGVQTFNQPVPQVLTVQVVPVDFNDGKTPPNRITGYYVEGLAGSLRTTPAAGLATTGPCLTALCAYRISFAFTAAIPPANPATALKTFRIDRIRPTQNNLVDPTFTPVLGTYAVSNITTIPEPGSLALVLVAGAALAGLSLRRSRRDRAPAKVKAE